MTRVIDKLSILIGVVLFSFIPIIVRFGSNINLFQLSFFRTFISAMSLFIFFLISRNQRLRINKNILLLFLFGLFHAATIVTSFRAINTLTIALATVFLFAGNIYLYFFSFLFLKERFTIKSLITLTLSVVGLILICSKKELITHASGFDYIIAVSSGIFMSLVFIYGKVLRKSYDENSLTFFQNLIASVILIPAILIKPINTSFQSINIYLLIGVICTAIPFVLLYKGMKSVQTNVLSVLMTLNIPLPIIFGAIIFKEIPGLVEIIGIAIMIIATIIVSTTNIS
ncbi:MAG: EamA family transporter [DPANN group archaeon]|nr:EamA family transporter [DPANN group archaeon]